MSWAAEDADVATQKCAGVLQASGEMPFANLKDADDLIKVHGIKGATGSSTD